MNNAPWKLKFPQVYQKVRQIPLARNLPPAQWMLLAFENNLIRSEEYLPWAQNYYGLAKLNSAFFEPKTFSSATYHKFKDLSTVWGPQALPVFEWENVLFVACLDPHSVPSELTALPQGLCRPLLATYEDLLKAWHFCLESLESKTPHSPFLNSQSSDHQINSLKETEFGFESAPAPAPPPLIAIDDPPVLNQISSDSIGSTPPAPQAAPNLTLNLTPPQVTEDLFEMMNAADNRPSDNNEASVVSSISKVDSGESSVLFDLPEGLTAELPTSLPRVQVAPIHQEDSSFIPPMEVEAAKAAKKGAGEGTPVQITPITPIAPAISTVRTAQAIQTVPTAPTAPTTPMTRAIPVVPVATPPPITTIQTQELEEELTLGFTKAYQFYRNLMILKIKDNVVIPMRWDPSFKKSKSLTSIPLDQPSIFRIAVRTKKPFHGPISPNPINDKFFEYWFEGHRPNYITIYPLFFEKECVGLLLGASDDPLDRKDSLNLMGSTAEMIEINFGANLAA